MLTRTYKTKDDCVSLFINDDFNAVDSTIVTDFPDWTEHWGFVTDYDGDSEDDRDDIDWYDEDNELMWTYFWGDSYTGAPMWNTWFVPNEGFLDHWCECNLKKVIDCGFVAVMRDGEFYGLAINGCGYSFRDAHFTPLYDALGIKWHEFE